MLHWLLLDTPTFDLNTRRSRGHKLFKMAPTKQQGPKEKFLKKLQSFTDILYCNASHCVTIAYSIQYSNMLYRFVA
jgi:hypothetical protein